MDFNINPEKLSAVFMLPTCIADKHLKLSDGDHIKVLLYILRHISDNVNEGMIADACGVNEYTVKEALLYWCDCGVLVKKDAPHTVLEEKKPVTEKSLKPSRLDVAKRGNEDPKIRHLLNEAQIKMGRSLKSNESSTLVWIYDDLGLDVSIIILIIQIAAEQNQCNIRFIEKTAVDWVNRGITTLIAADKEIKNIALRDKAWGVVQSAFGIERRKPSKKESDYAVLWVDEWKFSKEMLVAAYEVCVNANSKLSIPYIAKVLESWHKNGYTKPEDSVNERQEDKPNKSAFDVDLFEKMLNSKD